jgi:hypothetical protein
MSQRSTGAEAGAGVRRERGWTRLRRVVRSLFRHTLVFLLMVVWLGAVVYPDPRPFADSIARLRHPPVDRGAVASVADDLPADYKALEDFALQYVAYVPAWTAYGLPWYFPTVAEVVSHKAGDCQARAVFFASLLEAKQMPYTLRYSFDHVWVDYPGKQVTDLEDPATSFVSDSGQGWLASLPKRIPVWSILKTRAHYHWTPMPGTRKALILIGAALIFSYGERRMLGRLARWLALDLVVRDRLAGPGPRSWVRGRRLES